MDPNLIAVEEWLQGDLRWAIDGFEGLPNPCLGNGGVENFDEVQDAGGVEETKRCGKRARDDFNVGPKSKACREKMRREKLNDRFLELSAILEPGRPPKSDKAMILSDATRMIVQLRNEKQQLKDSIEKLHETVKDLKEEKNELRDEKTKLKAEKEILEQKAKTLSMHPASFMPHPYHAAAAAAFAAQSQAAANKTTPFPGFPGMAMWQWMPPSVVDTSEDHKLRPPVA